MKDVFAMVKGAGRSCTIGPTYSNLFAEAQHWVLQAYHGWDELIHYLDDFVAALVASSDRITKA
jgi:hypothetical protein